MSDRAPHPVEWLQELALSIERLAARGVASGAVRGATDELRAGLPDDLDAQARALLRDGLVVLERFAREAAGSWGEPIEAWSRAAAAGAVRGAVEEARLLRPEMQQTTEELLKALKLWLHRAAAEAEERAHVIRAPSDRLRIATTGVIAGAMEQLTTALPSLTAPTAELASSVGRGFVRGTAEELGRQLEAARRNPLVRALLAGGVGLIAVVLLAGRRR
jgi:hypothetical protein